MRIAIYNEPDGGGIGGSEYCAAVLAAGCPDGCEVELIHHRPDLTAERIEHFFGEDAARFSLRYLPPDPHWGGSQPGWWRSRAERRRWKSSISVGADLLVTIGHAVPPFCQAERGILYVLFPLVVRPNLWPGTARARWPGRARQYLGRKLYDWDWKQRLDSYSSIISISEYTRRWTHRWWGCDSQIIYPPVEVEAAEMRKKNSIVAVGRFDEMKRQREMVETFNKMSGSQGAEGWRLECCGNPSNEGYYAALRNAAGGMAVEFVVGAERAEIKRRLAGSKIFWHAAGYGVDEQQSPERLEHFGIATVEAMAAGCVPVVIGKGGQPEIVEHGVSGFLWNDLDQLEEYTLRLMRDETLRERMSHEAQRRALVFSKEQFLSRFRALLHS